MAIVKFINKSKMSFKETLRYAASGDKDLQEDDEAVPFKGGIADDPDEAYIRMRIIQELWHKTDGRTHIHFVISPEYGDTESMEKLSKEIIKEFENFACFYGIHQNTDHIHGHYILNSVGFDGKKFSQSKSELKAFKEKVEDILSKYSNIANNPFLYEDDDSTWEDYYNDGDDYDDEDDYYNNDCDEEERHIYFYGTTECVDTSYVTNIKDDFIPEIYRNIDGKYYPVLPLPINGCMPMVMTVNPETDVRPMIVLIDDDGNITPGI